MRCIISAAPGCGAGEINIESRWWVVCRSLCEVAVVRFHSRLSRRDARTLLCDVRKVRPRRR